MTPPATAGVNNAIIQFGYAENGAPGQFYCTSRHEACAVAASSVATVPFQFWSDGTDGTLAGLSGTPCASGCSIAIPGLSQRMLYYQVIYRDGSNRPVAQTGLQVAAVP